MRRKMEIKEHIERRIKHLENGIIMAKHLVNTKELKEISMKLAMIENEIRIDTLKWVLQKISEVKDE